MGALPLVGLAVYASIQFRYGAAYGPTEVDYFLCLSALCVFSLRLTLKMLDLIGIAPIADILERANQAAFAPFAGALLGATAINIGVSLGTSNEVSATWIAWLVVFGLWFGFGIALAASTKLIAAITVQRDRNAGLAFGLVLFFASVPLARAAAMDRPTDAAACLGLIHSLPFLAALLAAAKWFYPENRPTTGSWQTVRLGIVCIAIAALSIVAPLDLPWNS